MNTVLLRLRPVHVRPHTVIQTPGGQPLPAGSIRFLAQFPGGGSIGHPRGPATTNTRQNKLHEEGNTDQCLATGRMPDRHR
jgi:hypothetical protein